MGRECLPSVAMVVLVQLGFAAMNVVSKLALDTGMSSHLGWLNKSTVPDTGIIQTKKMSEKFSASYTSTAIIYLMDRSLSVWKKLRFDIRQHSQLCLYIGIVGSAMAFALISWYVATLRTIASMGRECQPTVAMMLVQRGFAGMNVVSKLALDPGMSPLVAYRHLIAGVFLVPIAFYFKRGSWMVITKKVLLQIFFSSIFGRVKNVTHENVLLLLESLFWACHERSQLHGTLNLFSSSLAPVFVHDTDFLFFQGKGTCLFSGAALSLPLPLQTA